MTVLKLFASRVSKDSVFYSSLNAPRVGVVVTLLLHETSLSLNYVIFSHNYRRLIFVHGLLTTKAPIKMNLTEQPYFFFWSVILD